MRVRIAVLLARGREICTHRRAITVRLALGREIAVQLARGHEITICTQIATLMHHYQEWWEQHLSSADLL
eukprot:2141584-Rhodomonas_salina.1